MSVPTPIAPCFSLGQFVVYRVEPETKVQIVGVTVWINQSFSYSIRKEGETGYHEAYEQELVDWHARFEFMQNDDGGEGHANN